MDQADGQTGSVAGVPAEPIVTVDTHNFRHVIQHFGQDGNLLAENTTRVSIPCPICLVNNLRLANPLFPEPDGVTTEVYTVLPGCGHAFGHDCIRGWINSQGPDSMLCPTCRAPLEFCDLGHFPMLKEYGADEPEVQRQEIMDIQELLENPICDDCLVVDVIANLPDGSDSEAESEIEAEEDLFDLDEDIEEQ